MVPERLVVEFGEFHRSTGRRAQFAAVAELAERRLVLTATLVEILGEVGEVAEQTMPDRMITDSDQRPSGGDGSLEIAACERVQRVCKSSVRLVRRRHGDRFYCRAVGGDRVAHHLPGPSIGAV
jgi:hypothetical protein